MLGLTPHTFACDMVETRHRRSTQPIPPSTSPKSLRKNLMHLKSLPTGFFVVASIFLSGTSYAQNEPTKIPTEPVACDALNITTRVVSARRVGPGAIAIEVEYENTSNFPVKLNAAGGVSLFDSNGEKWDGDGNGLHRNGEIPAGIKFKHRYPFKKRAGGSDVTSVNLIHQFRVWGSRGLQGTCKFDAKNLPLSGG
jgi:hypothetical protein